MVILYALGHWVKRPLTYRLLKGTVYHLHCTVVFSSCSPQLRVRAVQVEFVARVEGDLDGAVVGLLLEIRHPSYCYRVTRLVGEHLPLTQF